MTTESGIIFKFKKFAIHDGPGIRTTVFLTGCPLRCGWCHNPEGLGQHSDRIDSMTLRAENSNKKQDIDFNPLGVAGKARIPIKTESFKKDIGKKYTVDEVLGMLEKDRLFYDESQGGVTFSGGEPLYQGAFLTALLKKCQEKEIHTSVDTSGYGNQETFLSVASHTDLVLFDLKLMAPHEHIKYTGVSNQVILENFAQLMQLKTPCRVRFPVIPGITDTTENIEKMGLLLKNHSHLIGVDLLPYHGLSLAKYKRLALKNPLAHLKPPDQHRLDTIKHHFMSLGLTVSIGG